MCKVAGSMSDFVHPVKVTFFVLIPSRADYTRMQRFLCAENYSNNSDAGQAGTLTYVACPRLSAVERNVSLGTTPQGAKKGKRL